MFTSAQSSLESSQLDWKFLFSDSIIHLRLHDIFKKEVILVNKVNLLIISIISKGKIEYAQ